MHLTCANLYAFCKSALMHMMMINGPHLRSLDVLLALKVIFTLHKYFLAIKPTLSKRAQNFSKFLGMEFWEDNPRFGGQAWPSWVGSMNGACCCDL